MDNKSIISKIKGLLKLANDNRNDDEGQAAFILAQKLMLKHQVDKLDLVDDLDEEDLIDSESVTIYKRLYWWERELGDIIARNFRVKHYLSNKLFRGDTQVKRKIVFFGQTTDLELAKEMYILAYDALLHFSDEYLFFNRHSEYTRSSLKQAYIRGFLVGLDRRFEEQVSSLTGKYELAVQIPASVEESYNDFKKGFGPSLTLNIPNVESEKAYYDGLDDGKSIDFTKSTIHE